MAITHRFIEDLLLLENSKTFCGNPVQGHYNILIIGTFNPNDEGHVGGNAATWFYGRNQNKFWRYLPMALTNENLHPDQGVNFPAIWKQYCFDHNIIIIDMIKNIHSNIPLENFSDREVNARINENLNNVDVFNIREAFKGITFDKVLYSLLWSDQTILSLIAIRNMINQSLLDTGCIQNINQIRFVKSPSRNDAAENWFDAINL
jgi:hypothetical protein